MAMVVTVVVHGVAWPDHEPLLSGETPANGYRRKALVVCKKILALGKILSISYIELLNILVL
jgi:hypothetical protein